LFISAVPERERDNICSYQQITQKSKLGPGNRTDLNLASTTHDVFILESRIDQEHKKAKKKKIHWNTVHTPRRHHSEPSIPIH
jgi:hypothetical protein